MRSYTALLLVLPALVVGHPLQERATTESNVAENEPTTNLYSSGTDTPVSASLTSASAASEISGGQTSESPTATSASPAEESPAAETGMASSASSASASPVEGDQVSSTTTAYGSESLSIGAASSTGSSVAAPSGIAVCEADSWNAPGTATIKLSDVHLQWGPPGNPSVKNVYGSADWFNFPFWCQETEFTIFAFPDGTSSSDMGDVATSIGQQTCTLSGFSQHGQIPVVQLDIFNEEPYVHATDLSGFNDVTLNAECGIMRPRAGTEFPSLSADASGSENGYPTQSMSEASSVTVSGSETGSANGNATSSKSPPEGLETDIAESATTETLPTSTSGSAVSGVETSSGASSSASATVEKSAVNGVETDPAVSTETAASATDGNYAASDASGSDGLASPTESATETGNASPTSPIASSSPPVGSIASASTAIFVEDGMTSTLIGGDSAAATGSPTSSPSPAAESTIGSTLSSQASDSSDSSVSTASAKESGSSSSGSASGSLETGSSSTSVVPETSSASAS